MRTALPAARGGQGKGKRKKTTMVRNFESLTILQGSLKPDLPSLESVMTDAGYLASLLSTMGHLNHKRIVVSESSSTPAANSHRLMS